MLNKIRNQITPSILIFVGILVAIIMASSSVGAQLDLNSGNANVGGSLEQGTCLNTQNCENAPTATEDTVNSTVALVINVFSWIVGVVSVIMIIWGGFKYITSGGDSNNVTAAKNTILYAIIGLVIVALAQVIVRFVLGAATGGGDNL